MDFQRKLQFFPSVKDTEKVTHLAFSSSDEKLFLIMMRKKFSFVLN